jgi:hypothetical protein
MFDRRETILARLAAILQGIEGVTYFGRNVGPDLSSAKRPAIVLLDGNEQEAAPAQGNHRVLAPTFLTMSPVILIAVQDSAAGIGANLNALRLKILAAIGSDTALDALCTPHGRPHMTGCAIEVRPGEKREGIMQVLISLTYPLTVQDLTPD